jgi:TPP-dependent pyruvate/acetoin dehydrogenase alpha subunit
LHVRLNRFYGHFEGDAMTYRAADEVANARQNSDPLNLFRQRVVETTLLQPEELDEIDRTARDDIARTMVEAKAAPLPTEADLMTDVYFRY